MDRPERFDELLASLGSPRTSSARRLPPRERDELPAIPDHELIRCIGQGAYGEVWLARNILGTYRAIKIVFRDSFSSEQPYEREFRGIQRFEPVSRANDGLMDILQVGRNDALGCFYYVMELADCVDEEEEKRGRGEKENAGDDASARHFVSARYIPRTLAADLKQHRRLPAAECVQLGLSLTSALGHLHRHGLIHRDIKPSNIILVQGVPKLADIGLVVEIEEAFSFVGTEGYIAPEGPTSPQADLYSLGKVLYEASHGKDRKEFPEPMTGLCALSDRAEQERLLELNAVILKACAGDIRERYQSAEEFHADLALIQSGKSVRRRRRLENRVAVLSRVAFVVGIAALIGFGGYVFQRQQTAEARRLSLENIRLAQAEAQQRQRAEDSQFHVQLQRAQELLTHGKHPPALTQFAHLLRQHSTNRFIAEQILATLSQENFALPIARFSHSNEVLSARFSSDGVNVVTASRSGVVQIWNARTGKPLMGFPVYDGEPRIRSISPDGEWIAMAGSKGAYLASWRGGPDTKELAAHGAIHRMAFDSSNSRLLLAYSNEVDVMETQSGRRIAGPLQHDTRISTAAFSAAGDGVITSSHEDSTARLWNAETGELIREFMHQTFSGAPTAPELSPDGSRVITTLHAGRIRGNAAQIHDAKTGEALSDVLDYTFPIRVLEFSPDGTKVIIGGNGRLASLHDGRTGERLLGPFEFEEAVIAAAFSADGTKFAIGCGTGWVRVWNCETGALSSNPLRHGIGSRSDQIHFLAFTPDGDNLLVGTGRTAWLWDIHPGAAQPGVLPHDFAVTFAQFSRDGTRVVTAMDERVNSGVWSRPTGGRSAVVWDAQTGRPLTPPLMHDRGVIAVAFSPDAKRVVTTSWDRTAKLWNAEAGEPLAGPLVHPSPVRSAFFSKDGKRLWTSSWNHSAWLWNGENGTLIRKLLENDGLHSDFHGFPDRTDDLSPDENWIVTGGQERLDGLQVWNATTGEARYQRKPFPEALRKARFSPDGKRIVTSSVSAHAAHIWDATTGKLLVGPLQHRGQPRIHYAEFSPDGSRVVTAGYDGTACIWDSQTGRLTAPPLQHKGEVIHAEFSPDGKRIVTASWWDHAAFIWDAETGFQIGQPLQHEDWVTHATFSPDAKRVVTASADKTARIWEVPMATASIPEWLSELAEAVAGQRLDANGTAQPVPLERLLELRMRLTASATIDPWTHWVKWFFADRESRPRSWSAQF